MRKTATGGITTGTGRTWRATLSHGAPDCAGDRVLAAGIQLGRFADNPVALLQHEHRALPIGRWSNLGVIGSGWEASLEGTLTLAPEGISEEADRAAALIEAGILKGVSIGFRPIDAAPNSYGGQDITKAELIEASVVTLGCAPQALIHACFRATEAPAGCGCGGGSGHPPSPPPPPLVVLNRDPVGVKRWVKEARRIIRSPEEPAATKRWARECLAGAALAGEMQDPELAKSWAYAVLYLEHVKEWAAAAASHG